MSYSSNPSTSTTGSSKASSSNCQWMRSNSVTPPRGPPSRQRRRRLSSTFPRSVGEVPPPRLRMFFGQNGLRTDRLENPLLEQPQDALGSRVRLGEHGRTSLQKDLVAGEVDHFERHVRVTDAALGSREVLRGHLEVG